MAVTGAQELLLNPRTSFSLDIPAICFFGLRNCQRGSHLWRREKQFRPTFQCMRWAARVAWFWLADNALTIYGHVPSFSQKSLRMAPLTTLIRRSFPAMVVLVPAAWDLGLRPGTVCWWLGQIFSQKLATALFCMFNHQLGDLGS